MTVLDFTGAGAYVAMGGQSATWDAALTTSSATTARLNKRGLAFGTVRNATAGALVITYWACMSELPTDTPRALYDADGNPVTQTVAATSVQEIPAACAGVAVLVPVSDGAATVTYHFER